MEDSARPRSPIRSRILALAIIVTGTVWILQGLGVLTAGRSFMIGDPTWVVIGAGFVTLGVLLTVRSWRPSPPG
ncbi:MAG: hypothetical protein HW391_2094 [Chloroflexi bacterium]|nr:hypothetical protein [Chloroflexota bacterium]